MRRYVLLLVVSALLIGLLSASVPAAIEADEHGMNAEQIVEALYAAVEAGDLAAAEEYLADDVVLVLVPAPPGTNGTFVGKEAVLGWYESLLANNAHGEFRDPMVSGDRFTVTLDTWVDDLPVAPVVSDGAGVVQDGKVKALNWVMTPETMAKLDAAFAKMADEQLVLQWLNHWDTVKGDLEGIDELLSDDFVSHNMPAGDKDMVIAGIEAFRTENPNVYFTVDDLVIADGKAFLTNQMLQIPEGAPEGAEGEPISPPLLAVLGIEDGQITERWLFVLMEE